MKYHLLILCLTTLLVKANSNAIPLNNNLMPQDSVTAEEKPVIPAEIKKEDGEASTTESEGDDLITDENESEGIGSGKGRSFTLPIGANGPGGFQNFQRNPSFNTPQGDFGFQGIPTSQNPFGQTGNNFQNPFSSVPPSGNQFGSQGSGFNPNFQNPIQGGFNQRGISSFRPPPSPPADACEGKEKKCSSDGKVQTCFNGRFISQECEEGKKCSKIFFVVFCKNK
ncbi:hypothetical protein K502DRAFT_367925 [Neoconidiobolus thromboides FSU 785]|nr:hypothetical protein K502DRAFT_367925 [Neoconidiobolus thromboides FSU 785]